MKENLFNGSRPVEGNSDGRQLMVCDFDRTVCRVDMGNALLKRFAHRWEEIDRSYSTGEVGSRVAYGWCSRRTGRRFWNLSFAANDWILFSGISEFLPGEGDRPQDRLRRPRRRILLQPPRLSKGRQDRLCVPSDQLGLRPVRQLKRFLLRRFRNTYDRIIYVCILAF
jgi:hypothetical protein